MLERDRPISSYNARNISQNDSMSISGSTKAAINGIGASYNPIKNRGTLLQAAGYNATSSSTALEPNRGETGMNSNEMSDEEYARYIISTVAQKYG